MALYADADETPISTHSMMKTFRRCPQQTYYKYVLRLKPKVASKPLTRGTWMHKLLETYYDGGDWKLAHDLLSKEFSMLMDEEKEELGDLPRECARLMRGYLWHYQESDPWTVLETEMTLETEFPDGSIYRGRIDMLVENQFGLWIVDHKTHKTLPNLDFRLLDAASALYIWAAIRNKIPVQGFIWNYLRTKPPSIPKLTKQGRLSRRKIETDYPTFLNALKRYELDPKPHRDTLRYLKNQQYQDGMVQTSPFFRRSIIEKSDELLKRVAREGHHTQKRMNEYAWEKVDYIERVPDRSCTFSCSYTEICTLSLFSGEDSPGVQNLMRQRYKVGDPLEYYQDDKFQWKES